MNSADVDGGDFALWWLGLIVLAGAGYVLYRIISARDRGEDPGVAGRRALGDALPVIGAGIAGFLIFFALISVMVVLLFFLLIASLGGEGEGLGVAIVVLILVGVLALVGLPVGALVWVVRRRRRRTER